MPVVQRAVVNQRLYFCRLHVDWFSEQVDKEQVPRRIIEQSLGGSLIFHLVMAYKAYLSEIAESCSVPDAMLNDAAQLITLLENESHICAAATELSSLENSKNWLSSLLARYEQQSSSFIDLSNTKTSSGIQLVDVDDNLGTLDVVAGKALFDSLRALIERQRIQLEEW